MAKRQNFVNLQILEHSLDGLAFYCFGKVHNVGTLTLSAWGRAGGVSGFKFCFKLFLWENMIFSCAELPI